MKKIDKLILKSFIGPLMLTFALSVFVLLMQFVWKYVDDLVGKGLEFSVIAELLIYASATFVPMALPIAVLFASIMTMGNFGEKYELIAMKAGGIPISRVMMPMALVSLMLMGVAFYFANNIMPQAMLKYRVTLYDITRKKPALNIRPSEYYSEIEGYVIRVDEKDPEGYMMKGITIFDHTDRHNQTSVIQADHGFMQTSPDERYMIFTLYDGCTYSENIAQTNYYSRPFTTIHFDEQVITFDISSFAFSKTEDNFFSNSYQMLNMSQLDTSIVQMEDAYRQRINESSLSVLDKLNTYRTYQANKDTILSPVDFDWEERVAASDSSTYKTIINHAISLSNHINADMRMYNKILQSDTEYINRHYIEWHRKLTLSVACFLLFLIGAPFGSIVRKGGLGMPLVASVAFFVLYYVIGMIAEKAVREGALPSIGMWISTLVFIPIGIIFTIYATSDSSFFDSPFWRKISSKVQSWFQLLRRKK